MRDGKGTFEYANGDKYVGDWKEDMQQRARAFTFFSYGRRYEEFLCAGLNVTGEGIYYHAGSQQ